MKTQLWLKKSFLIILFLLFAHCGGSGSSNFAGFDLDMPEALDELNTDYVRISGVVHDVAPDGETPLDVVSGEQDATLTIRGHYALPIASLSDGDNYHFQLQIYYRADAYEVPNISTSSVETAEGSEPVPIFINTALGECAELNLTPDGSLVDDKALMEDGTMGDIQWLYLCTVSIVATFKGKELIVVPEENFNCSDFDADGDAMPNLDEIDLLVNPYEGDHDGDCYADGNDAFPKDPDEWLDTDEDGIGNNSDIDKDGDGLTNDEEAAAGTDELDSDTDDDSILDGFDNCPKTGPSGQTDTDEDGMGDVCDDDSDNDGLADSEEEKLGTDPQDPDSDDDGLSDGEEVSLGTLPLNPHSDGDIYIDGEDAFPLDSSEWADTDGDGVGDNSDLCPNHPDAGNTDTDGDGEGDVCDLDDDNDGVADKLENQIGSDPLKDDTDGDGLYDWFGGTQDVGDDPCLLDAAPADTDIDNDGFGSICDLSDDSGTDPTADEIHFNAIFVDPSNGDDANDGSKANPVATLEKAGTLAAAQDPVQDVYVTGDFALNSIWDIEDGIAFYGGFSLDFSSRSPTTNGSEVSSSSLETLIEANGTIDGTVLDGFSIVNNSDYWNAQGILVNSGNLDVINCSLELGNAVHVTGIKVESGDVDVQNTTIDLSDMGTAISTSTARGVYFNGSTGSISNSSLIQIRDYDLREAVYCASAGDTDIQVADSEIDVKDEGGGETDQAAFTFILDCISTRYATGDGSAPALNGVNISGLTVDPLDP